MHTDVTNWIESITKRISFSSICQEPLLKNRRLSQCGAGVKSVGAAPIVLLTLTVIIRRSSKTRCCAQPTRSEYRRARPGCSRPKLESHQRCCADRKHW